MVNYRINKILATISSATASVAYGEYPISGSSDYNNYLTYKGTWGILVASESVGHVSMSSGAVALEHIVWGTPIPCHPTFVSCSSGTVYILG